MPTITGNHLIGNQKTATNTATFAAINPATGTPLSGMFHEATEQEVAKAVTLAEKAFPIYKQKTPDEIANFLEKIAEEIFNLEDTLIERAMQETALPQGRLQGERGRTTNQLKLFASVVREGSWVDARIDNALPNRQPAPKADIRQMQRPLGPVGIFGASNFPLAFSVAGGDTASALAAGCTVVVKGHPAHPGTSELVGQAIITAANKSGMPEGIFSMIQGRTNAVGGSLVKHPLIQAIGFTGSYRGGKALFDMANQRPVPIPVYAEMGSINPVFILPNAMKERGAAIANSLAASVTLGVGQFCTNPGVVFLPAANETTNFKLTLAENINKGTAGVMLTDGIKSAYHQGTTNLGTGMDAIAKGNLADSPNAAAATIFTTNFEAFSQEKSWSEEVFGPSSILVNTDNKAQLLQAAKDLSGHLTATIHGTSEDFAAYQELFDILERKVGRLLLNGFPTGVEVCHSMVHGGPFPATTAPQTTSVGTNAIKRFARPVCYQNFPTNHLPSALQDKNPLNIWRLVDGKFKK